MTPRPNRVGQWDFARDSRRNAYYIAAVLDCHHALNRVTVMLYRRLLSSTEIGVLLHRSGAQILYVLKRENEPIRPRGGKRAKSELFAELKEGVKMLEIADRCGL